MRAIKEYHGWTPMKKFNHEGHEEHEGKSWSLLHDRIYLTPYFLLFD